MRRLHRKRLLFVSISLFSVMAGCSIAILVTLRQLQPNHHFQHMPVIKVEPTNASDPEHQTEPVRTRAHTVASLSTPHAMNILIIGSDIRYANTPGHSDTLMLVHINLQNSQYDILSIPRDSRVYMTGRGYTKLTSVQYIAQSTNGIHQGILATVAEVSHLTGAPINYYLETDYWGLQNLVDTLGGINMNLPFKITLTHAWYAQDEGKTIPAGSHFLNGRMVTEIVHERYSLRNGDYSRQQLQEKALISIAETALEPKNITKLPVLTRALSRFLIGTNMKMSDLLSLALASKHFKADDIHYFQVPGKSIVAYDYLLQASNDEIQLNMAELKRIIHTHFEN